jgi:hypothetical protein|tara:strand:+ start:355 stop:639 length:285 start_codon:yes stop_codon:yes gene_type:complete
MDLTFITNNLTLITGMSSAGLVLWVLKKVPNEHICSVVETSFETLGKAMTLGLGKWSITKKVWNSTIEPWFIDLVDNFVGGAVRGFVRGLRSDK